MSFGSIYASAQMSNLMFFLRFLRYLEENSVGDELNNIGVKGMQISLG